MYATDREGNRRLTPQARRFKQRVQQTLRLLWMRDIVLDTFLNRMRDPATYLAVYIEAFFATPRQRDLDNVCKIVLDSISEGMSSGKHQVDDRRVVSLHQSKRIRPLDPCLYLEIDTLDAWTFEGPWSIPSPTTCTDSQFRLSLPLPPSFNSQYATDHARKRRLTPQALRFKDDVRRTLRELRRQGLVREEFLQRLADPGKYLALALSYCLATPLQRDLDNGCKITIDALCQAFSGETQGPINDNRVVDIHQCERLSRSAPHLYLELEVLDRWDFDETYVVLQGAGKRA